jgi:DNA-binding response OmpR family regulator
MANANILMIEDDRRLARMVVEFLSQHGMKVHYAEDAGAGFAAFDGQEFDLVLLDLMLPDGDGMDVCAELKRRMQNRRDVPIIMVTARGDLADRVVGLELGADDYISKPFEARELLARIRAVLRRASTNRNADSNELLRFGRLEIDRATREVRLDQVARPMTPLQFDLLVTLARNAGRVLSRDQLRQSTRGESSYTFDRAIDVHIGKIRLAIEDDIQVPTRILTIRGVGYVFSKTQEKDG